MRKIISILLFMALSSFLFAKVSYYKQSKTIDGFEVTFYESDSECERYMVILDCDYEQFRWEFNSFNEAKEHFTWLQKISVWTFEEDKKIYWREYAYYEDVDEDGTWVFYISKDKIIDEEQLIDWR